MFKSFRKLAIGSISLVIRFRKGEEGWRGERGRGKIRRNEEKIHTERERKKRENPVSKGKTPGIQTTLYLCM